MEMLVGWQDTGNYDMSETQNFPSVITPKALACPEVLTMHGPHSASILHQDDSLGGLIAQHGLAEVKTQSVHKLELVAQIAQGAGHQQIPGISSIVLDPMKERPFKRMKTEPSGVDRLCNIWGENMPAVLEVSQDGIALVCRISGNVEAANSKLYKMLNALGGGNTGSGKTLMRTHMLRKLKDLPTKEEPYVYETSLIGVDGVPMFFRGSVIESTQTNEVVWSLSDTTELVQIKQSLQSFHNSCFQLISHNKSASQMSSQLEVATAIASQKAPKEEAPATGVFASVPPSAVNHVTIDGPYATIAPQKSDWTAWSQPQQPKSPPTSKTKTRRPYRFCSKCWLKRDAWVLRSIKLPDGSIFNLNKHSNDTCPVWPDSDPPPTSEQTRAYGTAFKRAQRSSQLHDIAFNHFTSLVPETPKDQLTAYLVG